MAWTRITPRPALMIPISVNRPFPKRVEKYEPFTVEVGAPFYYTSNVALVNRGRGRRRDHRAGRRNHLRTEVRAKLSTANFPLRQQFFYYQDFSGFNFR